MKSIRIKIDIPTKGWAQSITRPEFITIYDVDSVYSTAMLLAPVKTRYWLPEREGAGDQPLAYLVALVILRSLALQKKSYQQHGWSGMGFENKQDVYRRAARLLDYDV